MSVKNEDGFSYVTYKGKKKKALKEPLCSIMINLHSVINNIQDEVKLSEFTTKFKEDFENVLQDWNAENNIPEILKDNCVSENYKKHLQLDKVRNKKLEIDIICYGLGQFSTCTIARYQLGFLLVLRNMLQSENVYIYDPQFSAEERDFLTELHLNVLNINEEGKRRVKEKTVCFLPHCDLPLYNNLLWSNWDSKNLSTLAIIGNSFQSYEMNDAKSRLQVKAKYVYLANQFVREIKMTNNFHFKDIFNDLSIHYFKSSSLSVVESYVWTDVTEPEYSDDDLIRSCKM